MNTGIEYLMLGLGHTIGGSRVVLSQQSLGWTNHVHLLPVKIFDHVKLVRLFQAHCFESGNDASRLFGTLNIGLLVC